MTKPEGRPTIARGLAAIPILALVLASLPVGVFAATTAPRLTSTAINPTSVPAGGTFTMTFGVNSPGGQQVSLGAGIAPAGTGAWVYDPARDVTVGIPSGSSRVKRQFMVPVGSGTGSYDVIFGLWSAGFGTSYGFNTMASGLTVTAAPAPKLTVAGVSPSTVATGSTVTLSYTVSSAVAGQVALGAGIARSGTGAWIYDSAHDTTVSIATGSTTVTRLFAVPATASPGKYDVRFGLWSAGFGTQYADVVKGAILTVTPPPNPTLSDVGVSPSSVAAGATLTLSFVVNSPSVQQVSLGAGIAPAGTGSWQYDSANDTTVAVPAGTSTVNRAFSVPATSAGGPYDVRFGLWSAGFGTPYSDVVRTGLLTVAPPGNPSLVGESVTPASAPANTSITLSFTISSPTARQVSLGAGIAPAGSGQWIYDSAHDATVSVVAGTSTVTRLFAVPASAPVGAYDVRFGLWSAGFSTNYADIVQSGVLSVTAAQPATSPSPSPSPSPNPSPTPAPGPPTTPTLLSVSVSPGTADTGTSVVMSYTISVPAAGRYGLGAGIGPFTDPGNDNLVDVAAGTSTVTRPFYLRPDDAAGTYDVAFGFWDTTFATQYGLMRLSNALTVRVVQLAPYPPQPIPAPSPRTVNGSNLYITASGPGFGTTFNTGSSPTLSYTIVNTTVGIVAVTLGAGLTPAGNAGIGALADSAPLNVTLPVGTTTVTRAFAVPAAAPEGGYDLTWSLTDPSTGALYDSYTIPSYVWVHTQGSDLTSGLSLGTHLLASNRITLVPGTVNRISSSIRVDNGNSTAARVILRLRLRAPGAQDYVYDWQNDVLVSVPAGGATFNRPFAIPLNQVTGSYDVYWQLYTAGYANVLDGDLISGLLQVTNPTPLPDVGVPILMYHSVTTTALGNNYTRVPAFTAQMDYLAQNQYHSVTGRDIYNYIYTGAALPSKPVWITMDDSYQNIYDYARSVLQRDGLKASIFTITQYMGDESLWDMCCEPTHMHMTWDMLRSMQTEGTAVADGHTQHHQNLGEASYATKQAEIWGTQQDLVGNLSVQGASFAFPYGQYDDASQWDIAHSGFTSATLISQANQHTSAINDIYALSRLTVSDSDDVTSFAKKLNST
jgi:peptidoglycan/xylan/chitin deacetylase (PgdA/CDA1 family)